MKKLLLLAAIAALSGCAAKVISSGERTVVVRAGSAMVGDAQKLGEEECRKYGRKARLAGKAAETQFVFDCVQ